MSTESPEPRLMGVLNVTPDSFSDAGRHLDPDAAVEHGRRLVEEGAAIVDVGGESTRPGAEPVPAAFELERTIPVIERLAPGRDTGPAGGRVSIDTTKAEVAAAALGVGARIVNDVSAFRFEPETAGLVAGAGATCVLMHMLGEPRTMQADPRYEDVVSEVKAFLEERLAFAVAEGVPEEHVWLHPRIRLGKTLDDERDLDDDDLAGEPLVGVDISGLSIYTHHGAGEAEREVGQRLVFDISFELDRCDASVTDSLDDTVDYGDVCQQVAFAAQERSFRTLERLCSHVADRLLERYGVDEVTVRAAKPEPPIPLPVDEVAVEVSKERGD